MTSLNERSIAGQSSSLTLAKFRDARVTASRQAQISSRGSNWYPPSVRADVGRAGARELAGDRTGLALFVVNSAFSLSRRRVRGLVHRPLVPHGDECKWQRYSMFHSSPSRAS